MSKTGWEFIEPARRHGGKFVRACVRVDDEYGEIPVDQLQSWLEKMTFFDDHSDPAWQENPDPTPAGREFDFAVWDDAGTVWWPGSYDGVAQLRAIPATPEAWVRNLRESPDEKGLREMERPAIKAAIDEEKRLEGLFTHRPGEALSDYAARMMAVVTIAKARVEFAAGRSFDMDDVIAELQEIVDGDGRAVAVRQVRAALNEVRDYFPDLAIPEYPSDRELIDAALRIVRQSEKDSGSE